MSEITRVFTKDEEVLFFDDEEHGFYCIKLIKSR